MRSASAFWCGVERIRARLPPCPAIASPRQLNEPLPKKTWAALAVYLKGATMLSIEFE
jgi:hypothetical protein